MAISDDWDFNFPAKVISHIDGVLTYDGGTGAQPVVGDYIQGVTSGATGKVLARTGTVTAGTLTLTNVLGLFANNEALDILSHVDFDGIGNGGFKVGDTVTDAVTGTIDVKFIEYNIDGVAGHGTMWGDSMVVFTNDSVLDVTGGASAVGLADGVGVDEDIAFNALVDGSLAVPGAVNTNDSVIIHYDAGTIPIPEDAHIESLVSGADGFAQRVYGPTATGSIRVVDSDSTGGDWTDNETLRILDVEFYDTLVAGKVFSAGNVLRGATSLFEARVLAVIDDGDNSGKLILAGNTGSPWTDGEDIQVLQPDDTYVTFANIETAVDSFLDAAVLNLPAATGIRDLQRPDQGGIYVAGSLNIIRSSNAFYSLAADLFDELSQLDDAVALEGNVRDQLYTVLNNYIIPDLSMRFLEKGSFKDSGNNNKFTLVQSTGEIADIGNHGYFYDSSNPTPQPDMYIEQNGLVIRQDWLEGPMDMLLKVKTSTDPAFINPAVEALGQLIDNADFTVHIRPYSRTYDSNEVRVEGGIAVVALGNSVDANNASAQYDFAYITGTGGPHLVGEEATVAANGKRVQIVSSDAGATGNITYILKSGTNLVATDVLVGTISGASAVMDGAVIDLVAGYGTDIRVMVNQRRLTGGTTGGGPFVIGELVTQATSGATGYLMEDDGGTLYIEEQSGVFNAVNEVTGGVSGATNTPTGSVAWGDWSATEGVPKDIGGGVGDKDYLAVVSANITDASPQLVQRVYEWFKFILSRESLHEVNDAGGLFSDFTEGRIYRRLFIDFSEVRSNSPFGSKPGEVLIGAQGVFIQKETLDTADLRNIQLKDNLGDPYDPPNLQVLAITALANGQRAAVYRSTGAGNEDILRNEFDVGAVGGGFNQAADSDILIGSGNGGGSRTVGPIPNDVPDSGVLRVLDPNDTGAYLRFVYDTVNRAANSLHLQQGISQDTIGAVTGAVDLTLDDNAHVVFIEEESTGASVNNTIQFVSNIEIFIVVRIKGKQPFKAASTFLATGASVGAVLNPDNVVNLP